MAIKKKPVEAKTENSVNPSQKPWAVVRYNDDGVKYAFFDSANEASMMLDKYVADGEYDAHVIDCKAEAIRQAISWVVENAKNDIKKDGEAQPYGNYIKGFKEFGLVVFDLEQDDYEYVLNMAKGAIERWMDERKDEEEDAVEVDADEYAMRLDVATMVLDKVLDKCSVDGIIDIAKSMVALGDDDVLTDERLNLNRFAAHMAKDLCDCVLDTFEDEDENEEDGDE